MNITKTCPQCGVIFDGRSNRLYCSPVCKQHAFNAGQTRQIEPDAPVSQQVQLVGKVRSIRSASERPISKADVELEKLKLQQEENLRRMDFEERERERQYEILRQERLFEQETDLAELNSRANTKQWEVERVKFEAERIKLDAEHTKLQEQLKVQEQLNAQEQANSKIVQPPDEEEASESNMSGLGWVMAGVGGTMAVNWLINQFQKPTPPTQGGLAEIYQQINRSKTDSKPK